MKQNSPTITRIAFSVIIVFVLAQVVWWIIFQHMYISQTTDRTLEEWRQEVQVANQMYEATPEFKADLLQSFPHLTFVETSRQFELSKERVAEFISEQNRSLRMFAYEGPFFVLVVLSGLWIIARSLRSERKLKRQQQNFLSAITHEFKTPMSTLRLLIETALMRNLNPEKQKDYLKRMEAELDRLEQTSEQVLASARLEQGKVAPSLEPLELNGLIQGIIGKARPGLEARGARLSIDYSPEPLLVSIEENAFALIMNNLLDNAVKYSPELEKPIKVRLEQQADLILIHVEDQGMGIEEKERKQIFERFYRVGSELTRKSKGVGLGLHLVKSVTEAMNGWVKVEANKPRGSRFTLVFPRRISITEPETRFDLGTTS
jgi:signal transduction histidine kinase